MDNWKDRELQLKLKGFQTVEGWVKQLIWLATGTIALSVTLLTGWSNSHELEGSGCLIVAWILLGISLAAGLYIVGALARELNREVPEKLDIYKWNLRGPALVQQIMFVVGIVLFFIFAISNL